MDSSIPDRADLMNMASCQTFTFHRS
ncbi:hypothetical protein OIU84_026763 [Salix udensis]|uniref:Uncharacterized protein n=1 Tax=Salix udensis TaxID=889485 RepID=A0AAD6KMH9_9ROSI|nr:hypothetical protein OIU84_026763 [Salix udensis]